MKYLIEIDNNVIKGDPGWEYCCRGSKTRPRIIIHKDSKFGQGREVCIMNNNRAEFRAMEVAELFCSAEETKDKLEKAQLEIERLNARLSQIAHHVLLAADEYVKAGDAIDTRNSNAHEIYHNLYLASDPEMELDEPWEPLEELAKPYRDATAEQNDGSANVSQCTLKLMKCPGPVCRHLMAKEQEEEAQSENRKLHEAIDNYEGFIGYIKEFADLGLTKKEMSARSVLKQIHARIDMPESTQLEEARKILAELKEA